MRVEFVSPYNHSPKTGIGRYMHTLKSHLERSIEVSVKPMRFAPFSSRLSFLRNFPLAIEGHVSGSIVHIPQIMGCFVLSRRDYFPSVVTVHDLGMLETPLDQPLFNRFDRWVLHQQLQGLKRADLVLVHSDRTRKGLTHHLDIKGSAIVKVPSSIDSTHFRPIKDAKEYVSRGYGIDFDEKTSYLIYVGSELPRKNMKLLFEALAVLKGRKRKVMLLKVGGAGGDTWRALTISDAERFGCLENVIFTDRVSETDLPFFYNSADICVTPTRLEGGFAWLAMEGMACEKPIVATVDALVPESARAATFVVQDDDPVAFADAIDTLILYPELRKQMGEKGREIITSYTWQSEARCTIEAYTRLLNQSDSC
ncbi:MAG: glycosyltransferase family 4 protein [Candidatus Promineofilum sp.]|nr:glycosyltransferase family 4 protein [Promineifilum sp.]